MNIGILIIGYKRFDSLEQIISICLQESEHPIYVYIDGYNDSSDSSIVGGYGNRVNDSSGCSSLIGDSLSTL